MNNVPFAIADFARNLVFPPSMLPGRACDVLQLHGYVIDAEFGGKM
jgi:hypothetical protein